MLDVAENPFPLVAIFLGMAVCAGAMWYYVARHWLPATVAVCGLVAALVVAGIGVAVVTEPEKIRYSLRELAANVQRNDADGVVRWISSAVPEVQQRAREEMALCQFSQCWVTQIDRIEFAPSGQTAQTEVVLFCSGTHQMYETGSALVYLRVSLRRDPDAVWRLTDFSYTIQNSL